MKIITINDDTDFDEVVTQVCGLEGDPEREGILAEKTESTRAIVSAVRERGDEAVAEFTERFDGVVLKPEEFELMPKEIDEAVGSVEPALVATLERAHESIRRFHSKNLRQSWEEELDDGTILGQRITPIESVGVYVPGGKAYYPSSVLMNIAAASVAGVKEIVMVSPPSFEGSIHPVVLAAARIAGVRRVFRLGGAQAIAALAYGTDHVPSVLKITGPGNTYVTVAKRLIQSNCAIDLEAGPSEVAVIADEHAKPRFVAGELLAQAEHDEEARSILVTPSRKLVDDVAVAMELELDTLSRMAIIRKSLDVNGAMVVVRDLDEAVKLTNLIAPEHLAIYTQYPRQILNKVQNAGAIMLGETTTVALGDYLAGPNHILPTGRRARFASPLSAEDFRKASSIISFTPDRMRRMADDIMRLAAVEEFTAHARAAEMRK